MQCERLQVTHVIHVGGFVEMLIRIWGKALNQIKIYQPVLQIREHSRDPAIGSPGWGSFNPNPWGLKHNKNLSPVFSAFCWMKKMLRALFQPRLAKAKL